MKRHIILYIVLVLLLAACGPTPSLPKRGGGSDAAATQLALIDSLADVSPDSADILLKSVACRQLPGWRRWLCHLVGGEARSLSRQLFRDEFQVYG